MPSPTASEKIGAFAESVRAESVSAEVVHRVARAFVDTFAVTIAGRQDPASAIARDYVMADGQGGPSTIWGTGERVRPEDAALANGVMGHVLDYDDVGPVLSGHPSVVLLPALLALGEAEGATGGQISAAYAVGFEVIAKLPRPMVVDHYARGFHSTSTVGLFRAAIACAHLLGLNGQQTCNAIGIALAHVAGVHKSFGTMCKSLQAGMAAAAAIRCARLAARGFTAARDALDGKMGFMEVYCKGEDIHPYLKTLGEEPLEIVRTGIGVKKYPSCYCTHRAVQGILDMMAERPIQPSKVERILVSVEPGGLRPLIHKRPWLGLEGKFSMQYTLAAALLDGGVGLGSFTDAAVQRPEAQALLQKVEADEENTDPLPRRALVEVELRDEKPRTIRVENLRGGELLPLTDGELEEKLRDCARFSQLEMDVEGFLSAVWDWRDRPIRNILQQFRSA